MSKERAHRRAARESEAAMRTSARAAEAERRERRTARAAAVRRVTTDRLPRSLSAGRQTGTLARRRRLRARALVAVLLVANVAVWLVTPDWATRLGTLVVCLVAAPVLAAVFVVRQ
jgi:Flp pilus assembly protein TadB